MLRASNNATDNAIFLRRLLHTMSVINEWSANDLTKVELETILHQQLPREKKVDNYKKWSLTKPGDNYNSTMLALDVTFKNNLVIPQTISLVAKLMPSSSYIRETINSDITFRKEVNAYTLVSTEFDKLQRSKGIPKNECLDVFPKFYGARINRQGDPNLGADDTAVLLLENLKKSGYCVGDRIKGLDLKHMELGMSKLAQFHATSVALKILEPEVFKETVLKACESFKIAGQVDETGLPKWISPTMSYIEAIPECEPYLQKIETSLIEYANKPVLPKEPFSAFIHNDFWVNNILFKHDEGNGVPTAVKFVDFQLTHFSSPLKDVIFFIYSSAERDVIDNHYDDLIRLYHFEFTDFLAKLGCDPDCFSFKHLQEEINTFSPSEFAHILVMLKFICADKNQLPELSNENIEELLQINTGGEIYEKRVIHLIENFSKKGWL